MLMPMPILAVWYVNLMLAAFIVVCVFMILVVLIQRPKGGGLSGAFGGAGSSQAVFGAKVGDVLTWSTVGFFVAFVLLSIGLTLGVQKEVRDANAPAPAVAPVTPTETSTPAPGSAGLPAAPSETPAAPAVPAAPGTSGLPAAPAVPAAPAPAPAPAGSNP